MKKHLLEGRIDPVAGRIKEAAGDVIDPRVLFFGRAVSKVWLARAGFAPLSQRNRPGAAR